MSTPKFQLQHITVGTSSQFNDKFKLWFLFLTQSSKILQIKLKSKNGAPKYPSVLFSVFLALDVVLDDNIIDDKNGEKN